MFPSPPTQDDNAPGHPTSASSQPSTLGRVPACGPCQQRKVKCERKFPCSRCVKSGAQCVPAPVTSRQRQRRFPERALLERLHRYEEIMRQHNLDFEHVVGGPSKEKKNSPGLSNHDQDNAEPDPSPVYEAKNFWNVMSQGFRDDDADSVSSLEYTGERWANDAWDQLYQSTGHSLLGIRRTNVDISSQHPEPVHLFRLWQIYLDNVDPLLKVTHTPTVQPRIIETMSNVKKIDPNLEALMFSIYSIATLTLEESECTSLFGWEKEALSSRFYFCCEQALSNCDYLQTGDTDCLTALFLYLVSLGSSIDPRSLSSMLGIAMRIAKRLGLHIEASYSDCNALEAEQRRRLWWALLLYDSRITEMVDHKNTELNPSWNCKVPLNINDSALRPETMELPVSDLKPTESLFIAVRGELGNFIRHTEFYLDYATPALKSVAKNVRASTNSHHNVASLERMIEEKYLKYCNIENPLHFMTVWAARGILSRFKLLEQYGDPSAEHSGLDRDTAISHAFNMLENDSKIMSSPLTKRYAWLLRIHFPLPAYIHIVRDLKSRPISKLSDRAWVVMAENYDARSDSIYSADSRLFKFLSNFVLQAWEARVKACEKSGEQIITPQIVSSIRRLQAERERNDLDSNVEPGLINANMTGIFANLPMELDPTITLPGIDWSDLDALSVPAIDADVSGHISTHSDINQLDLSSMGLGPGDQSGWSGY